MSRITLPLNLTRSSIDDVWMRVIGSSLAIVAYFIVIHVDVMMGVTAHFIADFISVPYFVKTKSWDVVIMLSFLLIISLSKIL